MKEQGFFDTSGDTNLMKQRDLPEDFYLYEQCAVGTSNYEIGKYSAAKTL
jgi:hypothetical protein